MSKLIRLYSGNRGGRVHCDGMEIYLLRNGWLKAGTMRDIQVGDLGAAQQQRGNEIVELWPVTRVEVMEVQP